MRPLAPPVSPTNEEILGRLQYLRARFPGILLLSFPARTSRGHPIVAATITHPATPACEKQHVLVTAGRHGNEESGRIQAIGLIEWLLTPAAQETIRKQKIVVMPNLNPDGAEDDIYKTPGGVNPCGNLNKRKRRAGEDLAFEAIVERLQADAVIDMHARGYAGCSFDMVLYNETRPYTEDHNLVSMIASDMVRAGERSGAPHICHPMSWSGWRGHGVTRFCYERYKSLAFLTETPESNSHRYPVPERRRTGLARVKALLAWGNRRYGKVFYPGHPTTLVLGSFYLGIAARGKTMNMRRKSRIDVWRSADHFRTLKMDVPEKEHEKIIVMEYDGPELPHGLAIQCQAKGARGVLEVVLDGKRLPQSEHSGYVSWQDRISTFVQVFLPRVGPRRYELYIRYSG